MVPEWQRVLNWWFEQLQEVCPSVLFIPGTVFNALIVAVLISQKFGKTSTRVLLTVLAVSDQLVLIMALSFDVFRFEILVQLYYHKSQCIAFYYFEAVITQYSSWVIMLVTLERWISVCFPLKARGIITVKNTSLTLLSTALFLMCSNSHIIGYLIAEPINSCRYILLWHKAYKRIRDILHIFLFS